MSIFRSQSVSKHIIKEWEVWIELFSLDTMDKMVAGYTPKNRIKKWWWPVYDWSIALAAVQG